MRKKAVEKGGKKKLHEPWERGNRRQREARSRREKGEKGDLKEATPVMPLKGHGTKKSARETRKPPSSSLPWEEFLRVASPPRPQEGGRHYDPGGTEELEKVRYPSIVERKRGRVSYTVNVSRWERDMRPEKKTTKG